MTRPQPHIQPTRGPKAFTVQVKEVPQSGTWPSHASPRPLQRLPGSSPPPLQRRSGPHPGQTIACVSL
ncbi:hypothetical protein [Streptomyces sp. TE33382]